VHKATEMSPFLFYEYVTKSVLGLLIFQLVFDVNKKH